MENPTPSQPLRPSSADETTASIERDKRIGGCLLSGFVIAFGLLWWGLEYESSHQPASKATCASNLNQLSMGLMLYAEDHSGKLPLANSWAAAIVPYTKNPELFHCPSRERQRVGYAFNSWLSGVKVDEVKSPEEVPMLFETSSDWESAADPLVTFVAPHPRDSCNIAYLDGHCKSVNAVPSPRFEIVSRNSAKPLGEPDEPSTTR